MEYPPDIADLLTRNRSWAEETTREDPDFFSKLSEGQHPPYLWIGCSDSRVPPNAIVDLPPGELFAHRNIANVIVHTDLSSLSVVFYAVRVLKVRHVIVCGHYACGGVLTAMKNQPVGLIDNWLRHIQDVEHLHRERLAPIEDFDARANRMCELNVIEQVVNVSRTTPVQEAWAEGQPLTLHGLIYDLSDGLLCNLNISASSETELDARYPDAVAQLFSASA